MHTRRFSTSEKQSNPILTRIAVFYSRLSCQPVGIRMLAGLTIHDPQKLRKVAAQSSLNPSRYKYCAQPAPSPSFRLCIE